jgi:hypothetical protein
MINGRLIVHIADLSNRRCVVNDPRSGISVMNAWSVGRSSVRPRRIGNRWMRAHGMNRGDAGNTHMTTMRGAGVHAVAATISSSTMAALTGASFNI